MSSRIARLRAGPRGHTGTRLCPWSLRGAQFNSPCPATDSCVGERRLHEGLSIIRSCLVAGAKQQSQRLVNMLPWPGGHKRKRSVRGSGSAGKVS